MKKNLNHYLALPYRIEIVHIPEDEGGGYMARLPQFGAMGIVGDGDTKEEAWPIWKTANVSVFSTISKKGLKYRSPKLRMIISVGVFWSVCQNSCIGSWRKPPSKMASV